MAPLAKNIIIICWGAFFVVWIVAAIFTKRTVYHESRTRRLAYTLPIIVGWLFLFRGRRLESPWDVPVIPQTAGILIVAAIFCVSGVAFCFWARAVLGRNWSGTVTLKENHELIVRGPYRFVRHPIYTGIMAMLIGTALELGHVAGMIGVVLVFASLWIKSNYEEEVMTNQFPDQYPAYRHRVKRIIPFLL